MTAQNYGIPSSGWEVLSQVEGTEIAPSGGIVKGMVVTFRTGHGVTATVFIGYDQYTRDAVISAVGARAAQLDAITGLSAQGI